MNIKKILGITLLASVVIAAIVFANMQRTANTANTMQVATTFYPLYEYATTIGGDKVTVTNMTPAGAEPHDFEPSPQTLTSVQRASVFIYNGGTFEPWVEKFLPDYKNTAVKASQGIPLLEVEGSQDPHFWLDPKLSQTTVQTIRDALVKAAPEHTEYFNKNASDYIAKLTDLHSAFEQGLKTCEARTVVTAHDAFTYVADRYGLDLVPIAGMNPDDEPSPAKLAEISTLVREKGVSTVFFESLVSPRLADTIAQETGVKTAILDPIEGLNDEDQKQGKSYLSLQRDNLAALRAALGCQ